jgi:twinkle protein
MRNIFSHLKESIKRGRSLALIARRFSSFMNFNKVTTEQIVKFLKENNIDFKIRSSGQLVTRICPLCTKPHKNETSNMWTLNLKAPEGAFYCFRCGQHGGWSSFVSHVIGEEITSFSEMKSENDVGEVTASPEEVHTFYMEKKNNLLKAANYIEQFVLCKDKNAGSNTTSETETIRPAHIKIVEYLINPKSGRGLSLEILKKFDIGIGEEMFRNSTGNLELVPVIYFPMYQKTKIRGVESVKLSKTKIRGMGSEYKKYQRIFPSGSKFALFGLQTFPKQQTIEAIVITEGEFDAMAVHQATGLPSMSLPFGASNLPRDMLTYLTEAKRIYLWMDFDEIGQLNIEVFAEKLGLNRTFVVKDMKTSSIIDHLKTSPEFLARVNQPSKTSVTKSQLTENVLEANSDEANLEQNHVQDNNEMPPNDQTHLQEDKDAAVAKQFYEELFLDIELENIKIKDANDALRLSPHLVQAYIKNSRPFPQENIVLFSHLRDIVRERIFHQERFQGVKSGYFRWFNGIVKGFRRGELSILTGATGTGKTTFLTQYGLDFCLKGVPTLWCSFELKNEIILTTMLRQLAGIDISKSAESFEYWADQFERIPMYFQAFYGSTDITKILNIIDYSIYTHNVTHIVLDNLQFMLSGQGKGFERFELQDDLIAKLRTLATEKNVHITLVIHPKKTDDGQDLSISSIFGTSKSTQEADNIFIIQNRPGYKILDIKKNRYDGEIGKVALLFDSVSKRFEHIVSNDIELLTSGTPAKEIIKMKREMISENDDPKNFLPDNSNSIPIGSDSFELKMEALKSDLLDLTAINSRTELQKAPYAKEFGSLDLQTPSFNFDNELPKSKEVHPTIYGNVDITKIHQSTLSKQLMHQEDQILCEERLEDIDDEETGRESRVQAHPFARQDQISNSSNPLGFDGQFDHNKWRLDDNNTPNFYTEENVVMTYEDILNDISNNSKYKKKNNSGGQSYQGHDNRDQGKRNKSYEEIFEEELMANFK